jgi:hypothetical protein
MQAQAFGYSINIISTAMSPIKKLCGKGCEESGYKVFA